LQCCRSSVDLFRRHPEQQRPGADVLPAVGLHFESGDELKERADVAFDRHAPALRRIDAGHDLQKRALACAVVTDQSHTFASVDRHRDRLERLDRARYGSSSAQAEAVREHRIQRVVALRAHVEFEIDVFEKDPGHQRAARTTRQRDIKRDKLVSCFRALVACTELMSMSYNANTMRRWNTAMTAAAPAPSTARINPAAA
jgi:hypothetical protein